MATKAVYLAVEISGLLSLAAFTGYLFYFNGQTVWFTRFIMCNNQRYSKPFVPWENELIPDLWVFLNAFIAVPVMIFITKIIYMDCLEKKKNNEETTYLPRKRLFRLSVQQSCYIVGLYLSGLFLLLMFLKISQLLGGSPAPYFLTLCGRNCSSEDRGVSLDLVTSQYYIQSKSCGLSFGETFKPETLSSFPCLHSSITVYAATYFILFSTTIIKRRNTRLFFPTFVSAFAAFSILVVSSRVTQFRNHLMDVIAGSAIGFFAAFVQTDWVKYKHRK